MSYYFFVSPDGTKLRGWSNDNEGSPAVLVPGIAGTPDAYPSLQTKATGLHVHSFFMRGTHGSSQPRNRNAVSLADHATDVIALMDSRGLDKAILIGGGYGVDVVFEVLKNHPDRVYGILAIAGMPRLTGVTPPNSLSIHEKLLFPVTHRMTQQIRSIVPTLGKMSRTDLAARLLVRSKVIATQATAGEMASVIKAYAEVDREWFANLIDHAGERCEIAPEDVTVPVTFLVGDEDSILSMAEVRNGSQALADSRISEVHGGLLLGVEQPETTLDEALRLAERAGLNPMEYLSVPPQERAAREID